jgi:hypothetical protein
MPSTSVPKTERRIAAILKEAEERFCHEMMGEEERLLLLERIKKLRIRLALP